jgi:putative tryptophan/tyrosine transport system substrate-binding protein
MVKIMNKNKLFLLINKSLILTFILLSAWIIISCGKKSQADKVYKVGIISGADPFMSIADGFKSQLKELGYIEGKNISYDFQKFHGDLEGVGPVIQKFVADKVDLIFAFPTEPALIAKSISQATNIPVIFAMAGIEGNTLVESVPHPGEHITGVRFPSTEATVKRLEILHELVPKAKRILIIYDSEYPTMSYALAKLWPAASLNGLVLVEDPIHNLEELKTHLLNRASAYGVDVDAVLIMPDILTHTPDGFGAILEFSQKFNLPIGGGMSHTADLGALFSFVPDNIEMGVQAATLADKVFQGTPAGSIMVITPDCYLRLNYKVIQKMGLVVSEGLLNRAKEILR